MIDPNQEIYQKPDGRIGVRTVNKDPSLTQQQFQQEADINYIMAKYERTGQITHISKRQGFYADVSEYTDYQQMLEKIKVADDAFSALPAKLRNEFNNNPAEMIKFLSNPANYERAKELGLVDIKPTQAEVVNAEAAVTLAAKSRKKSKASDLQDAE